MIVLVTGGSNYNDMATVFDAITKLDEEVDITLLVHGDAKGADSLAYEVCKSVGITQVRCPANWTKYKKAAGHIRNKSMLDLFPVDIVLAFPGNNGTANMKKTAEKQGIQVIEANDLLAAIS